MSDKNNDLLLIAGAAAAVYFLVLKPKQTAVVPAGTIVKPVPTVLPQAGTTALNNSPAGLIQAGGNLLTTIITKLQGNPTPDPNNQIAPAAPIAPIIAPVDAPPITPINFEPTVPGYNSGYSSIATNTPAPVDNGNDYAQAETPVYNDQLNMQAPDMQYGATTSDYGQVTQPWSYDVVSQRSPVAMAKQIQLQRQGLI